MTASPLYENLRLLKWQVEALNPTEYISYCIQLIKKFKEEAVKHQGDERKMRDMELNVNKLTSENSSLTSRLSNVRLMLEEELDKNLILEKNNKLLENQLKLITEVLFDTNHSFLNDEQKAKLSFLDIPSAITHQNNPRQFSPKKLERKSASLLAPFKYDETDDSFEKNEYGKRVSEEENEYQVNDPKKSRNSLYPPPQVHFNYELAGTGRKSILNRSSSEPSLTNLNDYEENIEKADGLSEHQFDFKDQEELVNIRNRSNTFHAPQLSTWNSAGKLVKSRPHIFIYKSHYAATVCNPCGKRIKFGSRVMKCQECKTVCHIDCQIDVPVPCIPVYNTPKGNKQNQHHLTEYIPGNPPYIPALVIHCIYTIECRGLRDIGLYRVPGSEREVRDLKEKFLRGKGTPCLARIQDTNVICGVLKDFLRNLAEPLITRALWMEFVSAAGVKNKDTINGTTLLCQLVEKLPLANRDTLSFLMIHLQKVAAVSENKMNMSSLATIFAPAIVGHSQVDPTPLSMLSDYNKQALVVEQLLTLPTNFWNKFINTDELITETSAIESPHPAQKLQFGGKGDTPSKQKIGTSITHPNKFFTSPGLFNIN